MRRASSLSSALLSLLIILAGATAAAEAEAENPLEPLDTSSPRASLLSLVDHIDVVAEALLAYRRDRSSEAQAAYVREIQRSRAFLDLSEEPAASADEVVERSFMALADILIRVPLPAPDTVPDADAVADEELTRWTLPGTEITYRPLEEGDRTGSWVLSPRTVASLPGWRDEVEGSPVLDEDAPIVDWQRTLTLATGPLIPSDLVASLPRIAHAEALGSPLWKALVALLGATLIVLLGIAWHRLIGRRGSPGSMRRHVLGTTTPLVILALLAVYEQFMTSQVNHGGLLAELVVLGATVGFWVAVAWLFRELVELVIEWVIATPYISDTSYDSHLLRLVSRVVGVAGVAVILLFGANELGIPALGLLAGASVGALVIGLATQSTLENLIGGMTLYADKPFKVGDFVGFGTDEGTVEDIGPRSTRIRDLDGTLLTVPNSDIVQARISNFTRRDNALFRHVIGLRYETTLEQIEDVVERIRRVLLEHPKVEEDDDLPWVRLRAFGSSSIDIETRAYVITRSIHEFMQVQGELLAMILHEIEACGTAIAFPSTTAYLTRDDGIPGPVGISGQDGHAAEPGPGHDGGRDGAPTARGRDASIGANADD